MTAWVLQAGRLTVSEATHLSVVIKWILTPATLQLSDMLLIPCNDILLPQHVPLESLYELLLTFDDSMHGLKGLHHFFRILWLLLHMDHKIPQLLGGGPS